MSGDGGLCLRLQPARTCDGDEYPGLISASGSTADIGRLAAGSTGSQMDPTRTWRSPELSFLSGFFLDLAKAVEVGLWRPFRSKIIDHEVPEQTRR